MLTWEDCPDCHGTGVILLNETVATPDDNDLPDKPPAKDPTNI